MYKALILSVFLLYSGLLSAQNNQGNIGSADLKNKFDISEPDKYFQANSVFKSSSDSWLANQSDSYQYTLMKGGFFTIGTNLGISDSLFDDQCQVTYGHPFAMSSNPLITVDGYTYNPVEFIYGASSFLERAGDTLRYSVILPNNITTRFSLNLNSRGNIEISYSASNNSSAAHTIKLGLLFDVALGKWGDGNLYYNQAFVQNATAITDKPENIEIWERAGGQKGIGISFHYPENKPILINAGNWPDLYRNQTTTNSIYDLALLHEWDLVQLQPGESSSYKIELALLKPDIHSPLFLRWDMPSALSVENNMLFPLDVNSLTKILVNDKNTYPGLTLNIPATDYIKQWSSDSPFSISTDDTVKLLPALVGILEIYDSVIVPVTLQLLNGPDVIDQITRNIFIPAAPFTSDGLTVSIDTVFKKSGFINLNFMVQKDDNNQILTSLTKNNIFFYKDDAPITDFTLGKDTTGGITKADIIFVLDVTGSMTEEIGGVKNNIVEFADALSAKQIDFQLGLVTFLDVVENVYGFTRNVQTFYNQVDAQYAHGGDDYPENSLQALLSASQFNFRPDSRRIFIWITDAAYHINDAFTPLTKEGVINELLIKSIQVNCIGNPQEQLFYYDQILLNTGGSFFDINGNFRDILLKVSDLAEIPGYVLKYLPVSSITTSATFKVEAHYAGLGGYSTIIYTPSGKNVTTGIIRINSNPINPNSELTITGCNNNKCSIELFNSLGQVLYKNTIQSENNSLKLSKVLPNNQSNRNRMLFMKISVLNDKGHIIDNQTIRLINN